MVCRRRRSSSVRVKEEDLCDATAEGNFDAVITLLDDGISPNCMDALGYSPLHNAARIGHEPITVALLLGNADPNLRNSVVKGITPLHQAVKKKNVAIVMALLQHKANTNIRDHAGSTPLHNAILCGRGTIAATLLEHNADPNRKDNTSSTPLHHAAALGNEGIVSALVAAKANLNSKNKDGETPEDKARASGKIPRNARLRSYLCLGIASEVSPMKNDFVLE